MAELLAAQQLFISSGHSSNGVEIRGTRAWHVAIATFDFGVIEHK